MRSRYEQMWDGKWTSLEKSFDLACCDCGLVHGVFIRVKQGKPQIRFDRNNRASAAVRRHLKKRARK